jgi:hypothetical protein
MEDILLKEATENYNIMLQQWERTAMNPSMMADAVQSIVVSDEESSSGSKNNNHEAFYGVVFFVLLAIQCGTHPVLVKLYMPSTVIRSTVVFSQEIIKLVISIVFLVSSGTFGDVYQSWNIVHTVLAAGIPSAMFVVQNYCNLMANQSLSPVTFVLLNQTKVISTAWCCFMLLGQMQTERQLAALSLLFVGTLLLQKIIPLRRFIQKCYTMINKMNKNSTEQKDDSSTIPLEDEYDDSDISVHSDDVEKQRQRRQQQAGESNMEVKQILPLPHVFVEKNNNKATDDDDELICEDISASSGLGSRKVLMMGVVPALVASFLSGLAGTLSQKTLQTDERNPYLFNVELSIFSCTFLLLSFMAPTISSSASDGTRRIRFGSPDFHRIRKEGLTVGWTWQTCLPILVNALGAILVGLVTKHSGAVIKGFANIFGILISAMLNQLFLRDSQGRGGLSLEEVVGGTIGILSLWLHLTDSP